MVWVRVENSGICGIAVGIGNDGDINVQEHVGIAASRLCI
jgi:hypothetical protein